MKRILIVDDEPTTCQLLEVFLTGAGYQVEFREDGYSGIEAMKNSDYDLVILDISLPHYNGIKVLQEMRSHPKLQLKPVIVLSASEDEEDIERARKIGISEYLIKPPQSQVILGAVEKALKNSLDF